MDTTLKMKIELIYGQKQRRTEQKQEVEMMVIVFPYKDTELFYDIEDYISDINLIYLQAVKNSNSLTKQNLIMGELSTNEKSHSTADFISGF